MHRVIFLKILSIGLLLLLGVALTAAIAFFLKQENLSVANLFTGESSLLIRKKNPVSLIFVGDIMLSRAVNKKILEKEGNFHFPFLKVSSLLNEADIACGNLENPISDRGTRVGSIYSFRADPEVVNGLRYAGFDCLSLANNHIWDYGSQALVDTLTYLSSSSISGIGAGINEKEANSAKFIDRKGSRFAFLAYTDLYPETLYADEDSPGISRFSEEVMQKEIAYIKNNKLADIITVLLHWGVEYESRSRKSQQVLARSLIDSGANLVIGHHPHVVQETERYKDGFIAYSLGNFVFDQNFSTSTMTGLALKVEVINSSIKNVTGITININEDFQPADSEIRTPL